MKRVPIAYMRAIFSSYLASNYMYQYGIDSSILSFYTYVSQLLKKLKEGVALAEMLSGLTIDFLKHLPIKTIIP